MEKRQGPFTSTGGPHGGNEATLLSLYIPMAHLGFIIVPNATRTRSFSRVRDALRIVLGFQAEQCTADRR